MSIRFKIILPYLFLTAAVATLGIFTVTRLIASTIDERFTNQLLEAGRVAGDGIVRQEERHLEVLRPMTQTLGVSDAIQSNDVDSLRELLEVQAYNANLDSLLVLDGEGTLLMRLDAVRTFHPDVLDTYQFSSGGNYAHLPIVSLVLNGFVDSRGDKYSGLVEAPGGPYLYTSAPILLIDDENPQGKLVGVMLVGTSLDRLVMHLKTEALSDLAVYVGPDQIVASTLPDWRQTKQYQALTITESLFTAALNTPDETPLRNLDEVTLFERQYRAAYAPMRVRDETIGIIGVFLPSNFIVTTISTSRITFIVIFSLAIGLVVVVGFVIARQIVRPVRELVRLSNAYGQGDLTQRARQARQDELGILARTFNEMAAQLQVTLAELEEDNAKIGAILESIADGVVVRGPRGEIVHMNSAAELMLTTPEGLDLGPLERVMGAGSENRDLSRIEVGSQVVSVSAADVMLDGGSRVGTVLVMRDVTREAMVERTKNSFLDHMGHELRTPLTAIRGYAEILHRASDRLTPDKFQNLTKAIFDQTMTLSQMIDQILGLTAIESGRLKIRPQRMNLYTLVETALIDWRSELAVARLEPQLTGDVSDLFLEADARLLRRAVDALLDNACHYSPQGGLLDIRLERRDGYICLEVADPGVGISAGDLPHIFERFFRGTPADQDGKLIDVRGIGQGLYVVKSVVEAHGGVVQVESSVGEGSTFILCLPVVPPADTPGDRER